MADALIVDDHQPTATALAALVRAEGFSVSVSEGLVAARSHLAKGPVDLILLDLKLRDGDGLGLLDAIDPNNAPAVVLITGEASVQSAVEALRRGVTDYLVKPVDTVRLKSILGQVATTCGLARELRMLSDAAATSRQFGQIIGASTQMQEIFQLVSRIAPSSASVLLTGESGTGKEVVAQTIHDFSRRRGGPFIAVNCGAITPTLMESELFGHERGAFTGAERRHRGMFERAHLGTLFLDEITEMPPDLQVKLLRVLETGVVRRVGSEDSTTVDVRMLAATNRQPEDAVDKGLLRQDLYYRLKVFQLTLPPLRQRPDDVDPLVEHFLTQFAKREGEVKTITAGTRDLLRKHPWPGNVRELRNVLYSAYVLADKEIRPDVLPPEVRLGVPQAIDDDSETLVVRVGTPLADVTRRLVLATLAHHKGNKTRAAETLGVSLKTLYARLAEYRSQTGSDVDSDVNTPESA